MKLDTEFPTIPVQKRHNHIPTPSILSFPTPGKVVKSGSSRRGVGAHARSVRMPIPVTKSHSRFPTIADVQARLGGIPNSRLLTFPAPGTATTEDLLDASITQGRLCELVDGVLVEKAMGWQQSGVGLWLGTLINLHLMEHNIGYAAGSDGMIRFKLDLVRMPDLSFIRWDSVADPDEIEKPAAAFLDVVPDLVAEVLSPSNTRREMEIKLEEYAKAGVKLVWYLHPERKEVDVYPKGNPKRKKTLGVRDTLDGGRVMPGFSVSVAKLFESRAPKKIGRKTNHLKKTHNVKKVQNGKKTSHAKAKHKK